VDDIYFNFNLKPATSRWSQVEFWGKWRRMARNDRRFVPPYFPGLDHLSASNSPYQLFVLEAMRRRRTDLLMQPGAITPTNISFMPEPAAVTMLMPVTVERQEAFFGLFHCTNDATVLSHFFETMAEETNLQNFQGPTGISPFLQYGVLGSHWHEQPPLHTPYSPPFLLDLVSNVMEPAGTSSLYWAEVPPEVVPRPTNEPALLTPLEPSALAGDLYPLMITAFQDTPPGSPSREETRLLQTYLAHFPTFGWLALVDESPAGFILMQPDLADCLRRARGGHFLWWRAWFRWARNRPVTQGRLLFGAVLPHYRGRGIGRQLWLAALRTGREQGWQAISIGPVGDNQGGNQFLLTQGANPRQQYTYFSWAARGGGGMWW